MLQVGNGGTSGSLLGNVTDNALLAFDRADPSYTFTGNIGGSGSIEQIGGGVLILAGTNSYGGATTVASGMLQFATSAALPPTSPLSVSSGATINLNGVNVTASAIGGSGIVALGTATLTLTDTTTTLLTAQVVGAGSLIKNGPGTLVLSASQGYTGGTTISGGALQIGNGVAAGSLLGNLLDNGQLLFDRTGTSSFGGSITAPVPWRRLALACSRWGPATAIAAAQRSPRARCNSARWGPIPRPRRLPSPRGRPSISTASPARFPASAAAAR